MSGSVKNFTAGSLDLCANPSVLDDVKRSSVIYTAMAANSATSFSMCSHISEGTSFNERIGDAIFVHRIVFLGHMRDDSNVNNGDCYGTFIIADLMAEQHPDSFVATDYWTTAGHDHNSVITQLPRIGAESRYIMLDRDDFAPEQVSRYTIPQAFQIGAHERVHGTAVSSITSTGCGYGAFHWHVVSSSTQLGYGLGAIKALRIASYW